MTKVRISSFRLTALERPVGRVGPTEASVSTYKKRDLKKIKAEKNMIQREMSPEQSVLGKLKKTPLLGVNGQSGWSAIIQRLKSLDSNTLKVEIRLSGESLSLQPCPRLKTGVLQTLLLKIF